MAGAHVHVQPDTMAAPRFTAARYTEREDDYARLLYAAPPAADAADAASADLGADSRFAAALFDAQRGDERAFFAALFAVAPLAAAELPRTIAVAPGIDAERRNLFLLANRVRDNVGVEFVSDSRGDGDDAAGAGGGALRVRVLFPWLKASLLTGYERRDSTEAALVGTPGGNAELRLEPALGATRIRIELRKRFEAGSRPPTDVSGAPLRSPPPSAVDIVVQGAVLATADFGGELADAYRSERARMLVAAFSATRVVCTLASLRVMRAAAAAYAAALTVNPVQAGLERALYDAFRNARRDAGLESPAGDGDAWLALQAGIISDAAPRVAAQPSGAALAYQQQRAALDAGLAVGEPLLAEMRRSETFAVNSVTPLKRIAAGRFVARENELLLGDRLKEWRDQLAVRFGAVGTSEAEIRDAVRAEDNWETLLAGLRYAVASYPQVDDVPDQFAERLYTEMRTRFDAQLRERVREFATGKLDSTLRDCVDEAPESAAVRAAVRFYDTDAERSARQAAAVYLLAVARPGVREFVDVGAQSDQLAEQLRLVRRCVDGADAVVAVELEKLREAFEDEQLYRDSLRGALDRASLREAMLRSLGDVASQYSDQLLAVSGVARTLSQQLRRRLFLATTSKRRPAAVDGAGPVDDDDDDDGELVGAAEEVSAIEAIDAEVLRETRRVALVAFGGEDARLPANDGDVRLKLQPVALPPSTVRIVVALLDALVAKLENAAFDAVTVLDEQLALSVQDSRLRFSALLATLRSARVFASAMRRLYEDGEAPDISDAAELQPEDEIDLLQQQQRIDIEVVKALNRQLGESLSLSEALAPAVLKPLYKETGDVLAGVRASLSSTAFADRALRLVGSLRIRVQQEVLAKTREATATVTFSQFVDAINFLSAAGYLAQVEFELARRRGDDEDALMRLEESLRATERVLARSAALAILSTLRVVESGAGVDVDPLNEALREYRDLLRTVVDEGGAGGFVPIPAEAVLESYFNKALRLDEQLLLANMRVYGELQQRYFVNVVRRPLPRPGVALLRDFELSRGDRERIRDRLAEAVAPLGQLVAVAASAADYKTATVEAATLAQIAASQELRDDDDADDRSRVALLERVARQTRRYLQTVADLAPIKFDERFEQQFEQVKTIEGVVITLLRDIAKIDFEAAPDELRTVRWDVGSVAETPDDELADLLRDAQSRLPRADMSSEFVQAGAFLPPAQFTALVDELEVQMTGVKSLAQLRGFLSSAIQQAEGSTDVVQIARLRDIERLLDAGGALLDTAARIQAQVGQFGQLRPDSAAERLALATQLERLRNDLLAHQLRIEQISTRRSYAQWASVQQWEKIGRSLNLRVARLLGSLPSAERVAVDAAVLKVRKETLDELKKTTTALAADLTKQLREIETAAKRAADANKTGAALEQQLERLQTTVQRLSEGALREDGERETLDETLETIDDLQRQIEAKKPTIDDLAARVKETEADIKRARKTLADAERFSSGLDAKTAKALADVRRAAAQVADNAIVSASLQKIEQESARIENERKRLERETTRFDTASKNLRSVIDKFDADAERRRRLVDANRAALEALGVDVERQRTATQAVVDAAKLLQRRGEETRADIALAKATASANSSQLTRLEVEVKREESDEAVLKKKLDSVSARLNQLMASAAKIEAEKRELERSLEKLISDTGNLRRPPRGGGPRGGDGGGGGTGGGNDNDGGDGGGSGGGGGGGGGRPGSLADLVPLEQLVTEAREDLGRTRRLASEVTANLSAAKRTASRASDNAEAAEREVARVRDADRRARDAVDRVSALVQGGPAGQPLAPLIERLQLAVELMQKFTSEAADVVVKAEPEPAVPGPPPVEVPGRVEIDRAVAAATAAEQLEKKMDDVKVAAELVSELLKRGDFNGGVLVVVEQTAKALETALTKPVIDINALATLVDQRQKQVASVQPQLAGFSEQLLAIERNNQLLLDEGQTYIARANQVVGIERSVKALLQSADLGELAQVQPRIQAIVARYNQEIAQITAGNQELARVQAAFDEQTQQQIAFVERKKIEFATANESARAQLALIERSKMQVTEIAQQVFTATSGGVQTLAQNELRDLVQMSDQLSAAILNVAQRMGVAPINEGGQLLLEDARFASIKPNTRSALLELRRRLALPDELVDSAEDVQLAIEQARAVFGIEIRDLELPAPVVFTDATVTGQAGAFFKDMIGFSVDVATAVVAAASSRPEARPTRTFAAAGRALGTLVGNLRAANVANKVEQLFGAIAVGDSSTDRFRVEGYTLAYQALWSVAYQIDYLLLAYDLEQFDPTIVGDIDAEARQQIGLAISYFDKVQQLLNGLRAVLSTSYDLPSFTFRRPAGAGGAALGPGAVGPALQAAVRYFAELLDAYVGLAAVTPIITDNIEQFQGFSDEAAHIRNMIVNFVDSLVEPGSVITPLEIAQAVRAFSVQVGMLTEKLLERVQATKTRVTFAANDAGLRSVRQSVLPQPVQLALDIVPAGAPLEPSDRFTAAPVDVAAKPVRTAKRRAKSAK